MVTNTIGMVTFGNIMVIILMLWSLIHTIKLYDIWSLILFVWLLYGISWLLY